MAQSALHHCGTCNKETLHKTGSIQHLLHWILIVLTGGLWIVVYVIALLTHRPQPKCVECGTEKFRLSLGGYITIAVVILYFSYDWGLSAKIHDLTGFSFPYDAGKFVAESKETVETFLANFKN